MLALDQLLASVPVVDDGKSPAVTEWDAWLWVRVTGYQLREHQRIMLARTSACPAAQHIAGAADP